MGRLLELVTDTPKLRYKYSDITALLPAGYREKIAINEEKNRTVGNQLLRWCLMQATHFFDPATASVLQFIVTRTYLYAKQGELISINHFLLGVFSGEDGRSVAAPAVRDKATVYKALGTLEKVGAIDRTRVTVNAADVISLICVNAEAVLSMTMTKEQAEMLRVSKKQKRMEAMEIDDCMGEIELKVASSRVGGFPTTRLSEKPTTEYINKYESKKELSCSIPRNAKRITRSRNFEIDCNDTAETAIEKAVARVTERRNAKVRRAAAPRAGFIALADLNATWQSVMIESFGSCTFSGLTHKEYGIFKRIASTHTMACTWREFLLWVVQNWSLINKESRELDSYKKKKTGDWSLQDDSKIFLGTGTPDIFMMTRNFAKLVKRYSQHALSGSSVRPEESAEIVELRKVVERVRKESAVSNQLLQKALSAPKVAVATPRVARQVRIVNPKSDTFFEEADSSLPEWK